MNKKDNEQNSNDTLNVSDFINNEYRSYSIHTITQRAIPLFIDGLKPVQRKTLFTAKKECPKTFIRVSTLAGALPKIGGYHHGSASGEDATVKMAQDFNNNVSLLEGEGAFGTRAIPVAAAARYIMVRLSNEYKRFFKDDDVLPYSLDEDDHPEPICYLPLIPFSLVNGTNGVAVGAATKILPRKPSDLAKSCIEYLNDGKIGSHLKPFVKDFRGTFKKLTDDGSFEVNGKFTRNDTGTKIVIKELPLDTTHESYVKHLDKLRQENNPIFTSYIDDTTSSFEFEIKLSKYGKTLSDEELIKKLKLRSKFKENITLIVFSDTTKIPDDKSELAVKVYNNPKDVIKEFVDFRIMFFEERIKFNINRCITEIDDLETKIDFIKRVIDGKFKIKNRTRREMSEEIKTLYDEKYSEKLISIPIYSMSKDNIETMTEKVRVLKEELTYWKSCDAKSLYLEDLNNLLKELK